MTKTNTIAIDNFISHLKSNKINMVTASVLDGIISRMSGKGTITPKQALYLVEKYKKHHTVIPASIGREILEVMEKGGTQDQQLAEKSVVDQLDVAKTNAVVSHFNGLFQEEGIPALIKDIDNKIQLLKSKMRM
jgi:hypothetical protein